MEHHGSLYRFSLLGNGMVKKIQTLGDGLRLVLFEWTHMPISQQVYAQIALSVRFRQPPHNLQALTDRIQLVYGKAGFLERGMNRSEVQALLGSPTSEEQGALHYVFQRQHDQPPGSDIDEITWTIPLEDDVFVGLSPQWKQERDLPPEPNSVQWILATLEVPLEEDGEALKAQEDAIDVVPRAGDDELLPLLARVVELLPEASDAHWWMLCEAARLLADRGVKDPRVLQIVSRRFLDPQLNASTYTIKRPYCEIVPARQREKRVGANRGGRIH